MPELAAYADGVQELLERDFFDGHSFRMTGRRLAALAELHALIDPWQPCYCQHCAFYAKHAGAFE